MFCYVTCDHRDDSGNQKAFPRRHLQQSQFPHYNPRGTCTGKSCRNPMLKLCVRVSHHRSRHGRDHTVDPGQFSSWYFRNDVCFTVTGSSLPLMTDISGVSGHDIALSGYIVVTLHWISSKQIDLRCPTLPSYDPQFIPARQSHDRFVILWSKEMLNWFWDHVTLAATVTALVASLTEVVTTILKSRPSVRETPSDVQHWGLNKMAEILQTTISYTFRDQELSNVK